MEFALVSAVRMYEGMMMMMVVVVVVVVAP
jgi:hypothetical protein